MPVGEKTHNYKVVRVDNSHLEKDANKWANRGWRVVSVVPPDPQKGYRQRFVLERPVGVTHPDD
jgi:hypothetical protein